MWDFLETIAPWIYLTAAIAIAFLVAAIAYNPAGMMRWMLRKKRKSS